MTEEHMTVSTHEPAESYWWMQKYEWLPNLSYLKKLTYGGAYIMEVFIYAKFSKYSKAWG